MATTWKQTDDGLVASPLQAAPHGQFRVVRFRDGARPSYALIVDPNVQARVNGLAVVGGIRLLQHKDELAIGSERIFFSAESTPVVEVYHHDAARRRPRCPICRAEIQDGQSIVRCPGCSRIYHQIAATDDAPAKPCWTYSPACLFCEHPTSLTGEPTWRPAEHEEQ